MDLILFFFFAFLAVGAAINLVVQTHPISSALSLVGVMGSLAVLYLLLGAEFIAAVQLIVYAGAIMVLFIFVIMLLNAGAEQRGKFAKLPMLAGLPALFAFIALAGQVITKMFPRGLPPVKFGEFTKGGGYEIGVALFTKYLLPFEVTSILILIAILGAIVLAKKEID